jgi:hypothetical protein
VARYEPRKVLPCEGGLVPRQCLQSQTGIGRDPGAVPSRDGVVLDPALGCLAACGPAYPRRPDFVLRLQRNALGDEAAVVNPRLVPEARQPRIGQLRPALAPRLQQCRAAPVAHLGP